MDSYSTIIAHCMICLALTTFVKVQKDVSHSELGKKCLYVTVSSSLCHRVINKRKSPVLANGAAPAEQKTSTATAMYHNKKSIITQEPIPSSNNHVQPIHPHNEVSFRITFVVAQNPYNGDCMMQKQFKS